MKYVLMVMGLLLSSASFAGEIQYNMKVDGITCPFCVATSAKELKKIEGVKSVDSDLEKGLIKVCAAENVQFTDQQLNELFLEKGFTYKSMTKKTSCDKT